MCNCGISCIIGFMYFILSRVYTDLYINGLYINLYINLYIFYINSSVYISIYILRSNTFFYCTMTIYIRFDLKSINQEFILFFKLLKKHPVQYFSIEL